MKLACISESAGRHQWCHLYVRLAVVCLRVHAAAEGAAAVQTASLSSSRSQDIVPHPPPTVLCPPAHNPAHCRLYPRHHNSYYHHILSSGAAPPAAAAAPLSTFPAACLSAPVIAEINRTLCPNPRRIHRHARVRGRDKGACKHQRRRPPILQFSHIIVSACMAIRPLQRAGSGLHSSPTFRRVLDHAPNGTAFHRTPTSTRVLLL